MLHIISRHRYPLALSILLTCVLPSQYAGHQLRSPAMSVCVCECVHKGDEGYERTCISRTSANCSRAVAAVLLLPLPLFFLFLFLFSFCFCFCFSSCSSLCFCFCFAVLLLLPPSCTQLEAINFTCAQTMRQTVGQKERQGDKEKEREKKHQASVGEKLGKCRKQ